MNVCTRAAAVLGRLTAHCSLKASIGVIGPRGWSALTLSRCDTVAILSSPQPSMVGSFFAAPLLPPHLTGGCRDSTCTRADARDDDSTTRLSAFQPERGRPEDWPGRLPPETHWCPPPVGLVVSHCGVAAVQAATYRSHSCGLAVLS